MIAGVAGLRIEVIGAGRFIAQLGRRVKQQVFFIAVFELLSPQLGVSTQRSNRQAGVRLP